MNTILLIDDDQQLRASFSVALRASGYNVIEADCGAGGLELARRHLPDLILTDIHMPGGDGATLLRDIRRDPELRSRQVVLMTGRPDLVTPRKGMEDGADDFLVKPVGLEALLKCMEARFNRASISWRVEDQMLDRLRSSIPPQLPHELFTPMAGIIGLTEIMLSDLKALTPEEMADIAADVHLSALRLNRTLRNYLFILELGDALPEPLLGSLSLRQVEETIRAGVEEALRLNKRREDVTIMMNPFSLPIKPGDLSRMVEELVDNACKFSRQGTPIKIEVSAEGSVTITDQGRGLTVEEISRIGAFQQFDRKKHEQQGLGLGLVLVQKLSRLYKAEFSIQSQPGEGTTAQIKFAVFQL